MSNSGGDAASAGRARAPIYYGWWVLAAGAVIEMLAIGSISYSAGLFVLPLQSEFGLSRAAANSALPISFAGAAIMAPLVGFLLDRYPAERVIALGAVLLGAGFAAIALSPSLWPMVVALLIPIGFGGMAIGPLTTSALTSRWFYRRRGRALGIATVATSGGGIVVAPLVGWGIAAFGWRQALLTEAIAIGAIVIALAVLVVRSGPAELGLETHPENRGRPKADIPFAFRGTANGRGPAQWRYGAILSSLNFWMIGLVLAAITGIAQALVVTLVPYATELGFTQAAAIASISVFSFTAAAVKVLSGYVAEFVERRIIMLVAAAAMIASLASLLTTSDYTCLLLACSLAGASLGCVLPSSAALVASSFGAPSFGRVMGMLYVAVVLSSVVSVGFIGAVFDMTRGYDAAFGAFLVIAIVTALGAFALRTPAADQAAETLSTEAANIVANRSPR